MAKKINHRGHGGYRESCCFLCVLYTLCGFPIPSLEIIRSLVRIVLICVVLVALTPALVQTTSALNASDYKYWADVGSAALYMGDTYEVSGYTVKFVDYQPETDQVYISLWKGQELLNKSVLNASCVANKTTCGNCDWLKNDEECCDCFIWDDEIAIEIYYDPDDSPESRNPTNWENPLINIRFHERAKPEISLEIETNCEAYTARDSEIRIKVTIENDGEEDADLEHVDITIDPGDLSAIDDLTRHYSNLTVDEEKRFHTTLRVPSWVTDSEGELFEIVVNATGFDEEGVMYAESASTEVLVLPRFDLTVRKTVNSHISMDRAVWVRIDLENIGEEELEIELNDTVPEGFRLCGNESPPWRFNITPSGCARFSYHIEPVRPGVFDVPGAEAKFVIAGKNVSVWSRSQTITVDGAYIIMNKTAYPTRVSLGDPVTVTLNVRNTGNADAVIDLTDVIPSGASLISGNTTLHATLSGNQTSEIEYMINFSIPGNVTLAPPEIILAASDHSYVSSLGMPTIEVTGSLQGAEVTPSEEATVGTEPRSVDVPVLYEIALMLFMLCVVYLIGRFG
ncbi:MAG: hypothetical protein C4B59_13375 [Candidatus Methanogaster sp.]|uniref:Uncharacterized protein n=1 Tax=Candidatus Methanogaster sp. TaxID=3386292 RepID=A0AC61KZV9_9EURY|nr:MAG: hypothetical protein C4B59_13375 [ANME-2 cluster archaeon]